MKLTVLGSGSTGNGYILHNEAEALVIECGMPRQDCLAALDYNTKKVVGCLVTHEHGDHAKFIEDYMELMPCYTSAGTAGAVTYKKQRRPKIMEVLKTIQLGGFSIRPIPAEHDAEEPLSFIIDHADFGRMLFATDTYYLRYTIPNMNILLVECNYELQILNDNIANGVVPAAIKSRTMDSHMSLAHLKEMLAANDLSKVTRIVLIHMSGRNSNKEAFVREIEKQTGKCTIAAEKGLIIEINKTAPF